MIEQYSVMFDSERKPTLVMENAFSYKETVTYSEPQMVYELCRDIFKADRLTEEHVYMLCFTIKNKIIGIFDVSHGTLNASLLSPREMFQRVLLCGAASFILCHNHPSGECDISKDDMESTKRIAESAKLMGVSFLDHIIIGDRRYCSFKEKGMLP